jgi:hypothetical protein
MARLSTTAHANCTNLIRPNTCCVRCRFIGKLTAPWFDGILEGISRAGAVPRETRRRRRQAHAVQGRGAAQHLAVRLVRGVAVEAGDRLALEPPVVGVVRLQLVEADRDVNIAGFEQQHATAAVPRKAVRRRRTPPSPPPVTTKSFLLHCTLWPRRRQFEWPAFGRQTVTKAAPCAKWGGT